MRDRKLRAEKLTYLLDPNEIAKIKAPVEKPVFEHFHPTLQDPTESEEVKAERDMINDVERLQRCTLQKNQRGKGPPERLRKIPVNHIRRPRGQENLR
jgi:hypothetical protein